MVVRSMRDRRNPRFVKEEGSGLITSFYFSNLPDDF